ncbi:Arc family DNA-binding protein [Escherichia coli]|uniref:Arc family DNA-binding protein n=1 Tax=Escherichia coli TaxID=562 RepID=UPI0021142C7D|nr:Arc family DNA-binding protein [Escherichia coli]MCQ7004539.1 Arc family DNA-binding protein [Escherichia coli]
MAERKYRHPQVNLRMPEELKEKIAKIAEANGRSANAEMVMAIEAWVSYHERKEGVATTNINMPMTKDEMRILVDNVKEAVVSQLVGKYDFVPKTKDKS